MKKILVVISVVIIFTMSFSKFYGWKNSDEYIQSTLKNHLEVGSIIEFGSYYWRVVDIQEERALVTTTQIIKYSSFDMSSEISTWEESMVRYWLNNNFLDSFTIVEQNQIYGKMVENNGNSWFGSPMGFDTFDRIFLFSISEVLKYFGSEYYGVIVTEDGDSSIITGLWDEFDSERIVVDADGNSHWWWLRSPGQQTGMFANISVDGSINLQGVSANNRGGVRPAMWLRLE